MFSSQKKSIKPSQGHHQLAYSPEPSTPRLDQSEAENDYDVSIEQNQDNEHLHTVENNGVNSKLGSLTHSLGLSRKRIIWILLGFLLGFVIYQMSVMHSSKISTPVKEPITPTTPTIEPTGPIENKEKENEQKTEENKPEESEKEEKDSPKSEPEPSENKPKPEENTPKKDEEKETQPPKDQNKLPKADDDVEVSHLYTPALTAFNINNPTPLENITDLRISNVDEIPRLQISCYLYSKDHLNIIIRDADKERYELPHQYPFPYPRDPVITELKDSDFIVNIEKDPFDVVIKRKSTEEVIFKLTDRLVFTNLYIEISFFTPTNELYGFGERIGPLQYHEGTYTLFIVDRIGMMDRGNPGFNAQGHHSMYLVKEKSGHYHVNLLKNIAAQEVVIKPSNKITWKLIGGVLDFNFFLGDSPEDAIQKYHGYIGGWTMPAFWHLGHHQSKWWGYNSIEEIEYVLENFDKADLPLDAMWSDLEIYKHSANFNYDEKKFPPGEMRALYEKYKKRWIVVVQAYIPTQEGPCWNYPNPLDYTVKDGLTGEPLKGYEFSGWMYFLDFLNPKTEDYWAKMLEYMDSKMKVSGFWLDANEVTDLVTVFDNTKPVHFKNLDKRKYFKLPFYPGVANLYDLHIVKLDAIHHGGIEEYNVRSMSAFYQSQYTYNYLAKQKDIYFPFVLSRGNQFGNGQFSFHFIPDLGATWESLRNALAPVMNYNLYGIPVVGADICGMGSDYKSPPELCARWYQMGVFYVFARNHHTPKKEIDNFQEPYRYSGVYFDAIKAAIQLRYSLLKQLYTYFFAQPRQSGNNKLRVGTILRPLFFEFRDDTLPRFRTKYFEEQFMLSDSIMGTPVLDKGRTRLSVYFPNCRWFDMRYNTEVGVKGRIIDIQAELANGLAYFLRGGKIIMKQKVDGIRSSDDLDNKFIMIAGLDYGVEKKEGQEFMAKGSILDVADYSEETIYKACVLEECLMRINLKLRVSEVVEIFVESESPATETREAPVTVTEIVLLGVSGSKGLLKERGQFRAGEKEYDYTFDEQKGMLNVAVHVELTNGSKYKLSVV